VRKAKARLSYANIVATLALVLALGGASAFAATQLAKNSVGTKQLKKNAVTGEKVRNGSLSAADIGGSVASAEKAATAGRATFAESADHAATAQVADGATTAGRAELAKLAEGALHASNADTLGGSPPSAFQPGGSVQRVDWNVSGCGTGPAVCTKTLIAVNNFTLGGSCSKGATGEVGLIATAPASSSYWLSGLIGTTPISEEFSLGPTPFLLLGISNTAQLYQGNLILRSPSRTLALELAASQDNNGACRIVGTATTG
jgi:hypothetical protein